MEEIGPLLAAADDQPGSRGRVLAYVPLILAAVGLSSLAQLLLKRGMLAIGGFDFVAGQLAALLPRLALSPFIAGGIACYVASLGLWLMVLSRVEVSAAYPFVSVGFVVVAVAGSWLFGEALGPTRALGIALIVAGVVAISRS